MRLFSPVLANIVLITAAFGLGSLFSNFFFAAFRRVDRLAATLLAGLGSLGTLLFLVGMVRLSRLTILSLLIPSVLLGIWFFPREVKGLLRSIRSTKFPKIPALVILIVMIVTFVAGLAKPYGDFMVSDSVAYHYLGPRVWLRDSAIHPVPDESLTSFPAIVETLYAALLDLGGPRAMSLFAFSSMGLLLLVTYGFALRLDLDPSGALWAMALVATMPAVYRGVYDGYVDGILWCFVLLSFRIALDAIQTWDAALSGLFAGFAMGTKYHGVIALGVVLVCAALMRWYCRDGLPVIGRRLVILAAVAVAVASPWYLRNWIVLGFPIYPPTRTLSHYFPVKYMSPSAVATLGAVVDRSGRGMGHNFLDFILLPFRMTFHPANYLNGAGGVGLTLLTLAPFGIMVCWRSLFVRCSFVFVFLWSIAWFVTEQDARFAINVFVILAVFAVWGWKFVSKKAPRFGSFLASLSVACSILYGLIMIIPARASDMRAAISPSYEERRQYQHTPYLESFRWLNINPEVKKVVVLEPFAPTYYLKKDYLKPVGRFGEVTLSRDPTVDQTLLDLSELGITHVLDVTTENHGFRILTKRPNLILVFARADQRIYRVDSGSAP